MGERSPVRGVTLDAGALIAFERGDAKARQLLREALRVEAWVVIPAGVVAQVWRDGRRQVELSRLNLGMVGQNPERSRTAIIQQRCTLFEAVG